MRWWSLHTHSRYSVDDALSPVSQLVERAVELAYPALGLTDHGRMSGVAQLYLEGKKHQLPVAPGVELYLTPLHEARDKKAMHLTLAAYTGQGYRNLVALNNQAQMQRFNGRGRLDLADIAQAAEEGRLQGVACATGCRSGPVVRALVDRDELAAEQVVKALASWFPKLYVELMDHMFEADGLWDHEIVSSLVDIAHRLGLPTIVTSDSHYALPEEREAHDALKELTTWSLDPEEGRFNGHGYWLPEHELMAEQFAGYPWAFEGNVDLAAALKVTIPELDTFTAKIPDVTFEGRQWEVLSKMVADRLEGYCFLVPKKEADEARERVAAEMPVIRKSEMDGYVLLVEWICSFMTERGIWFQIRGSAEGSFVLYLLGITQENPLTPHWDVRMDRFLSGDRTSLPDVDIDIEHTRRNEVVAALEAKGYYLVQVGTQPTYGLDKGDGEEEKGSLRVKYFSTKKKQGITFESWAEVPDADKQQLADLASRNLVSGIGAHPGGYVVARDQPTVACLPLLAIDSSGTIVTAFDKGEVEKMGFPKIDLLGSKVMTALRICCNLIVGESETFIPRTAEEAAPGKAIYDDIPLDDKATMKRVSSGRTTGLFQLGGGTNRRGLMEMKPKKTKEIVAAQALMRPAPLNSGFTEEYMDRREKRKEIPALHADILDETKDTYGLAIYQEQVVGILRRIGVEPDQLTRLLKAVKASGKAHVEEAKKIVEAETESVRALAMVRGWTPEDWTYLHRCLLDYGAGYSFGKGHSVTYGVCGYNTGFLAEHHPLEYWTGMLNAYMGSKNSKGVALEPIYARAARDDGLRVMDAHVNHSNVGYTPDYAKTGIRKGLVSVPGVGVGCAQELIAKRPFKTLVDLGSRVNGKVTCAGKLATGTEPELAGGAIAALASARALSGLAMGDPIVPVDVGRKRKCTACGETFRTPTLRYEHEQEAHGDREAAAEGATA